MDYPLLNHGESDLDVSSLDIEQFALPSTDEDFKDGVQPECLVDYLLYLMDHGGSLAEETQGKTFGNQQPSVLFSVETRAPLRSVCPDKRCAADSRIQ
jgi:hypothetical protein